MTAPKRVPNMPAHIACEVDFAVTSATLLSLQNDRLNTLRVEPLAIQDKPLIPFAKLPSSTKWAGARDVMISMPEAAQRMSIDKKNHVLECISKLCATTRPNRSDPRFPNPSFNTQLIAPAVGIAAEEAIVPAALMLTAYNRKELPTTPVIEPNKFARNCQNTKWWYPGPTVPSRWPAGSKKPPITSYADLKRVLGVRGNS
mmetsp:Transcript_16969/g.29018  ORF Transcript_16969/g.29018 Transcript_16969/m.29018 type:complete len:201 (-) Transcript_16969:209-811(-)